MCRQTRWVTFWAVENCRGNLVYLHTHTEDRGIEGDGKLTNNVSDGNCRDLLYDSILYSIHRALRVS